MKAALPSPPRCSQGEVDDEFLGTNGHFELVPIFTSRRLRAVFGCPQKVSKEAPSAETAGDVSPPEIHVLL